MAGNLAWATVVYTCCLVATLSGRLHFPEVFPKKRYWSCRFRGA